jgi:hypothetical protein
MIMNDQVRIRKELVVALFKVLSRYSSGQTENQRNASVTNPTETRTGYLRNKRLLFMRHF